MSQDKETLDLSRSGAQPFPPSPPPSPGFAARQLEIDAEDQRFLEILKTKKSEKCLRCKQQEAVVAVVHREEEAIAATAYHFLYCKKCGRNTLWRLAFCPLCKKKFQSTKNVY